jgi:hypothetical protein
MSKLTFLPAASLSILLTVGAQAQINTGLPERTQAQGYDPRILFAPGFYPQGPSTHSVNGAPGKAYWQNRADYVLEASLDTTANTITGLEIIRYTNNSPDSLFSIWLQLDQNTYKEDARSNFFSDFTPMRHTAGYEFSSVSLDQNGKMVPADYLVSDTRMQIRLRRPLPPHGRTGIRIHYHYSIPGDFGNRTDYVSTLHGKIYEIAQWYPRVCVYDDRLGWNTLPFLGSGEFYCEYGDFDYKVTLPRDMIVAGSGELQNPADVLTPSQISRLATARTSDKTVFIIPASEAGDPSGRARASTFQKASLTWHFKMRNTRDVAFGASRAYVWDAARINLPGDRKSLAMSVYPVESAGPDAWDRSTEYLKASVEYFSKQWFAYPYPVAINEAGIAGGMEYPGILFDAITDKGKDLYAVTAHEMGHNWFPMIVGSDERSFAWMDEGVNTFIDIYAQDEFNKGEYAPKRDPEYAPGGGNPASEILPLLKDPAAPDMMMRADAFPEKYRHPVEYFKAALGLVLLREQILGKDRFDYAFRRYINAWAFRHPSPFDFFRTMENEGGENLSWFWREWWFHNWSLDLAVQGVHPVAGDPAKGYELTLANLDRMVMPCVLEIQWKDGTKQRISLPVETWLQSATHVIQLQAGHGGPAAITVDPDKVLPDADRNNNSWKP